MSLQTAPFTRSPAPRRRPGRVPGREVSRDCERPDLDHFTVLYDLNVLDRRELVRFAAESVLRVVLGVLAGLERPGCGRARRHPGAAGALQRGDAARVIVVAVRVQDVADVFGLEPERADVAVDDRGGLRERTVEQDVSVGRRDQYGGQTFRADVVGVAEDLAAWLVLVPLVAAVTDLGRIRVQAQACSEPK